MISTAEIAHALGGRRVGQDRYVARCPSHEDRSPSLSLSDTGDGLVLWHCHAGCSQAEVRDELVARGLWPRRRGRWTRSRANELTNLWRKVPQVPANFLF